MRRMGPGAGDDETRTFITQTHQRADAFLFGRRTYELFAGSWGSIDQMHAHPIGVALNEGGTRPFCAVTSRRPSVS
jgi:hypothetical protein